MTSLPQLYEISREARRICREIRNFYKVKYGIDWDEKPKSAKKLNKTSRR